MIMEMEVIVIIRDIVQDGENGKSSVKETRIRLKDSTITESRDVERIYDPSGTIVRLEPSPITRFVLSGTVDKTPVPAPPKPEPEPTT